MEEEVSCKQRLDWGTAYTVKGTKHLLSLEKCGARCTLALVSQFPDEDAVVAVELGFGLPKGSLEPPSFANGKVELPVCSQIRLMKAHASDKNPVTLSRGCHSCGR
jgi:hypothetical protein